MVVLKESEIRQEVINGEDFKVFFIKSWPVAKETLEKIIKAIDRPLLELAIKVLIEFGDRIYIKKVEEFNILA